MVNKTSALLSYRASNVTLQWPYAAGDLTVSKAYDLNISADICGLQLAL